jgi:hypothetical protein
LRKRARERSFEASISEKLNKKKPTYNNERHHIQGQMGYDCSVGNSKNEEEKKKYSSLTKKNEI